MKATKVIGGLEHAVKHVNSSFITLIT